MAWQKLSQTLIEVKKKTREIMQEAIVRLRNLSLTRLYAVGVLRKGKTSSGLILPRGNGNPFEDRDE